VKFASGCLGYQQAQIVVAVNREKGINLQKHKYINLLRRAAIIVLADQRVQVFEILGAVLGHNKLQR